MNNCPFWQLSSVPLLDVTENLPHELDVAILGNGYSALWAAFWLLKLNPKAQIAILNNDPYYGFSTIYRDIGYGYSSFKMSNVDFKEVLDVLGGLAYKTGSFFISNSPNSEKIISELYNQHQPYTHWLNKGELKKLFPFLKSKDGFFAPSYFTYDPIQVMETLIRLVNVPIYYFANVDRVKNHKVITKDGHEIICRNIIHTTCQTNNYSKIIEKHKKYCLTTAVLPENLRGIFPLIPFQFPGFILRYYQDQIILTSGKKLIPLDNNDFRSLFLNSIHLLMAEAIQNIPCLTGATLEYVWTKITEYTRDNLPIVDYNNHEYFMLGQGDCELVNGFYVAKIVANHLVNNLPLPSYFAGDRFHE